MNIPSENLLSNKAPGNIAPTYLSKQVQQLVDLRDGALTTDCECLTVLMSGERGGGVERVVEAAAAKMGLEMVVSRW